MRRSTKCLAAAGLLLAVWSISFGYATHWSSTKPATHHFKERDWKLPLKDGTVTISLPEGSVQ